MKPASNKQVAYAEKIAKVLNVALPQEQTAYAYWQFIDKHQIDYKYAMMHDFNMTYGEEIGQCYCEGWFC